MAMMKTARWAAALALATLAFSSAQAAARTAPPSLLKGAPLLDPAAVIHLDSFDAEPLLAEDTLDLSTGAPLRIGIERDLMGLCYVSGQEDTLAGGGVVWRLRIESPGAVQLRLRFSDFHLPAGCRLYLYGDDHHADTYEGGGPWADGEFVAWAVDGAALTVELCWPKSAIAPSRLPFAMGGLYHAYRDIRAIVENAAKAGACNKDVNCYPAWKKIRDASALISFVQNNHWNACSATMLNDVMGDRTPYLMAAHHCISQSSVAKTLQAYFFYYTDSCNSGHSNDGDSKNGATALLSDGPTDFSLLRLQPNDFSGIYFAGWDRASIPLGAQLVSVHHPKGSYRRICFGHRTGASRDMWAVQWYSGVTEGGSSGGGLFRADNHRFVGQLWDGESSCGNPSGLDYYGRFNRAYQLGVRQYLGTATSIDGAY